MIAKLRSAVCSAVACVILAAPAVSQPAPTPTPTHAPSADGGPPPSGYHMVLLVAGDKVGRGSAEGMTPAVTKALRDAQQFLPFKAYRLLDSAVLRGSVSLQTRLNGLEGHAYAAGITSGNWPTVDMWLREDFGEKRIILQTEFKMATGETVVAGTSRLGSGEALVVIITALAKAPGR